MGTAYAVKRTRFGASLQLGEIRLDAESPHVDRGVVRATLSAWNGALLYRDAVNLTSERARQRTRNKLAEASVAVEDGALVALDQACRMAPPAEEPATTAPPAPEDAEPGYAVLDAIHAYTGRFVAYPSEHAHVAHTLWIAHAHLMDAWTSTPRLAFLSPEPASGKTRGLEATELLVPNPVEAINVTPAYLFRKVGSPEGAPTILFDEIDTVFGPKAKENEELRGLLNAGHRRGEVVETEEIPAYCAVAVAGLGALPDTILTRSVIVRMRRRKTGERVEPFRRRVEEPTGHALRDRLAGWASTVRAALADAWPTMPDGVTDRDADVWEALLAVADAAGGEWPRVAREAAVALVAESRESTPSLGIRLLGDLRTVFGTNDHMATSAIVKALCALDEAPWGEVARGEPLNARGLASRLKPYGVASKNVRVGDQVVKGYARADLADTWSRYLPPSSPQESATSATDAASHDDDLDGPNTKPAGRACRDCGERMTGISFGGRCVRCAAATSATGDGRRDHRHQALFDDPVADVADVADLAGEEERELSGEETPRTRVCVHCGADLPDDWPERYCAAHGGQPEPDTEYRCLGCDGPLGPGRKYQCEACERGEND
jgi:hypothetical protein